MELQRGMRDKLDKYLDRTIQIKVFIKLVTHSSL